MTRHLLVAVVALMVGIGIVDPYACIQYSSGGSLKRPIPKNARARLERVAAAALALVPNPPSPYERQFDVEGDAVSDEKAAWNDGAGRWLAPGTARAAATWIWQPPHEDEDSDAPPDLEVRVYVNAETGTPKSLESVGGAPRALSLAGAAAVEVTTIGADEADRGAGGRVALPMTPEEAAHAITVIRILVADRMVERALLAAADGRPPLLEVRKPVREADRIESITVELYGGKHDVESLAAEIPTAGLRTLLDR